MSKVKVVSQTKGLLSISLPYVPFKAQWRNSGAVVEIEESTLEQIMFEPGVEYMFKEGMLYIEDMEAKKELGLEPVDAEEPVNIIVLTDKQRRQYWVNFSLDEFKKKVDELPKEQVELLADYAIDNRIIDIDKCDFMQQKCGRNIIRAIELNKADAEGRQG